MAEAPIQPVTQPKRIVNMSARARWASVALREQLADIWRDVDGLPNNIDRNILPPVPPNIEAPLPTNNASGPGTGTRKAKKFKVGIVGAGCAGMFTAMIFDHLREKYGLDVEYEILESSEEKRYGGRLFTYRFPPTDTSKKDESYERHAYYDVGAMRFPDIGIMNRTFKLFDRLEMHKHDDPDNKMENRPENIPKGELGRYYLSGKNVPLLYNDKRIVPTSGQKVTAETFDITGLPKRRANKPTSDLWKSQISMFTNNYPKGAFPSDPKDIEAYEDQAADFWQDLKDRADRYSVRQWLTLVSNYSYNTIEWLETLNFGNRWYDQALSEAILEELDFDAEAKWWCIEGGSSELTNRMRNRVKTPVAFKKRVTKMAFVYGNLHVDNSVNVRIDGEDVERNYDAVFNSAPLGSMQRMDLERLYLNWGTKQAIRSLGYGASCKVGIRFKRMWWKEHFGIMGGVAKTDLPIRCCVYPSYNVTDPVDKPAVLLCSYTWSQEAQRLGSLINRKSPEEEGELKQTLLHDLTRLHSEPHNEQDYQRVYKIINDAWDGSSATHFAYDWNADPHTTGAFAFFGPGQFSNMYPWIVRNTGKHIIIGEAASAHHAWVVGALESAVRGVYQFLVRHQNESDAARNAQTAYEKGEVMEPFGPLPAEFDRVEDIKYSPLKVPPQSAEDHVPLAPIGEIARAGILVEQTRMNQAEVPKDQVDSGAIDFKKDLRPIYDAGAPVSVAG